MYIPFAIRIVHNVLLAHRESVMVSLQLADLQMSLKRNEQQINWKEEHYKQEIADLQQVRKHTIP